MTQQRCCLRYVNVISCDFIFMCDCNAFVCLWFAVITICGIQGVNQVNKKNLINHEESEVFAKHCLQCIWAYSLYYRLIGLYLRAYLKICFIA